VVLYLRTVRREGLHFPQSAFGRLMHYSKQFGIVTPYLWIGTIATLLPGVSR